MAYWFEDLPRNHYVEVIAKGQGVWNPYWNKNVIKRQIIQIKDINGVKKQYKEHNLFRSLDVYKKPKGLQSIGRYPIVLDIDYDKPLNPIPNFNDLERVRKVAVQAIRILEVDIDIPEDDIKIVFSGCKGFHIEVRKEFNKASHIRQSLIDKLREENGQFGFSNHVAKDTGIDPINESHRHVRIKDTWNSWTNSSGNIERRKCFELSLQELRNLNINQIVDRATK